MSLPPVAVPPAASERIVAVPPAASERIVELLTAVEDARSRALGASHGYTDTTKTLRRM